MKNKKAEEYTKVPSVTEILKSYQYFSQVHPEDLEAAADRGTRVHSALTLPAPAPGVHLLTVLSSR
jgi:hypothetical protein